MLLQNENQEKQEQKSNQSQRTQNKKHPNQQKAEIHITATKKGEILIQNTNATLTFTSIKT